MPTRQRASAWLSKGFCIPATPGSTLLQRSCSVPAPRNRGETLKRAKNRPNLKLLVRRAVESRYHVWIGSTHPQEVVLYVRSYQRGIKIPFSCHYFRGTEAGRGSALGGFGNWPCRAVEFV